MDVDADAEGFAQEIQLLDLATEQVVRKYSGHSQSKHVIRSGFGGVDSNFVVSGSEGASRPSSLVFSGHPVADRASALVLCSVAPSFAPPFLVPQPARSASI